ncbi:MAG TPA: UDP-N-acetyl-D-mannosamine dehydrogenase [Xanthomonadaceae bacterium]|nr:UDP-N-acetyl-D-mannosamine dehydrogenase [Xanthomonadaceae bacterium]
MDSMEEKWQGTLSVIGLGYIGLPTAAMFASAGVDVVGVDISQRAVDAVNSGKAHIEEGNLDELVERCVHAGKLRATSHAEAADAFIIAVPTPVGHDAQHAPDVSYVQAAGLAIAPLLKRGNLVILESTSPVGTTSMLAELFARERPDLTFPQQAGEDADVQLAYCPERIIPGQMLKELVENDRIIGGMNARAATQAAALYKTFVRGVCHLSTDRVAEMVKLTENAFRDVNIAFANELSMICDDLGVNVWKVIEFANRHPRVSILNPGAGVGGHCIAVDPWFVVASAPERARLIRTAREVNDAKPEFVIEQVTRAAEANPGATIACLGLTYKPDVDDFRESPSLEIAARLTREYPGRVVCVDPFADALPERERERHGLQFRSVDAALRDAAILVVLVAHTAFRSFPRPEAAVVIDPVGFWR